MGGGCAPSHAAHSAEIPFLTARFTLINGNAIIPATGTATLNLLGGGGTFSGWGKFQGHPPSV